MPLVETAFIHLCDTDAMDMTPPIVDAVGDGRRLAGRVPVLKVGGPEVPDAFPNQLYPDALLRLNVNAGVRLAVATLVVNNGERLPALKLVTVPLPPAGGLASV